MDPAHVIGSESSPTDAGRSFHNDDPELQHLANQVPPDPHRYTVDAHAGPDGVHINGRTYNAEEFAQVMRHDPNWDGKTPIRLLGCDTGKLPDGFAHDLSRELGVPVTAPTRPVWSDSHGRVFSSGYEHGPDGTVKPKWPPDGEWKTFHPDGSSHPAGHEGFPPGHEPHHAEEPPKDARARDASQQPDADHHGGDHGQDDAPPHQPHVPDGDDDFDPPPPRLEVPPEEAGKEFAPWDRPHDSTYERAPNPPDPGSPVPVSAPDRDRVRDPIGPPPDHAPTEPEVLHDHSPLHPNTRYEVANPNGTHTTYFTDEHGDVKWVEATSGTKAGGFNPDINYPLLGDVKYRVDDNWTFHTDEHGQTDSMTGKPDYGKSDGNRRDDSGDYSAQGRARIEGQVAYQNDPDYAHVRWAGGHLAPNESGAPGEYVNMHGQMNASNSGHNKDGWTHEASWRAQESALADFDRLPGCSVDQVQVKMTRRADGLPEEVTMRWTQTEPGADGQPVTHTYQRVFPNVPENVNFDEKKKYAPRRSS